MPGRKAPASVVRPLGRTTVSAIIARYLELVDLYGVRATSMKYSEGGARGLSAEQAWAGTVAAKLAADPHRVPMVPTSGYYGATWGATCDQKLYGFGKEPGLLQRCGPALVGRVTATLFPSQAAVSLPTLRCRLDAMYLSSEQQWWEAQRLDNRSRGAIVKLVRNLRNEMFVWKDLRNFVETNDQFTASVRWLGAEFARCCAAEPGFLDYVGGR